MAGRTRFERRGRPPKAGAKRRQTTVNGRRPGFDRGSELLLAHRRQATGRDDLCDDLADALLGWQLIDREEHATLIELVGLVHLMHRAFGVAAGRPAQNWRSILAGAGRGSGGDDLVIPPGAQRARRRLKQLEEALPAPCWSAITEAIDGTPPRPELLAAWLVDLHHGLAEIAQHRRRRGDRPKTRRGGESAGAGMQERATQGPEEGGRSPTASGA
jgi:hypothetical protein